MYHQLFIFEYCSIVHCMAWWRTAKGENLLFGNDGLWKLGDFGSASERTFDLEGADKKAVNSSLQSVFDIMTSTLLVIWYLQILIRYLTVFDAYVIFVLFHFVSLCYCACAGTAGGPRIYPWPLYAHVPLPSCKKTGVTFQTSQLHRQSSLFFLAIFTSQLVRVLTSNDFRNSEDVHDWICTSELRQWDV